MILIPENNILAASNALRNTYYIFEQFKCRLFSPCYFEMFALLFF